ncbi:MAG TPA: hypothetical protein VHC49_11560 [Mycobacteriales bacterium]|nr:hypothetical protein [Mycobacteriales bacterium]
MSEGPVSMAMHIHASFSEGGSWAAGGGAGSMVAHLQQAQEHGVDVIWWTEHDWRMQAYGYCPGLDFDGTDERTNLEWFVQQDGPVTEAEHRFADGGGLHVTATGPEAEWGTSLSWPKAGNSFYATNLADTTLTLDVRGEQVGPDAEVLVELETSYRPSLGGRPAGLYRLRYVLADRSDRELESPLIGVIRVEATGEMQQLSIRPLEDIAAFWPDLVAEDSALPRIRLGVRARAGATAAGTFGQLRIERTRDPLHWPVRQQAELMRTLQPHYPQVTQYASAEISMVRHLNVFMADFELYPYPPRGQAPVMDDSAEATAAVVRWYQDRGALVQYNHPPITQAARSELVRTRALGADLMEVVNGNSPAPMLRARLEMLDIAARNGIFLTAGSGSDDHVGRDWLTSKQPFITTVWARSRTLPDLIAALGSGRAWVHHLGEWRDARMDLRIDGQPVMGGVLTTEAESALVEVVTNAPTGARIHVIAGACDRGGAGPSWDRKLAPADRPLSIRLERGGGRYLRIEVYDKDGALLGFGNPFWLLPADTDIAIPERRRLAMALNRDTARSMLRS